MTVSNNAASAVAKPGVGPVANSNETLAKQAASLAEIFGYCYALQDYGLPQYPKPDIPVWYNETLLAFTEAKNHALDWTTRIGPNIFASVPQSIINYSNSFESTMTVIDSILDKAAETGDLDAAQKKRLARFTKELLVRLKVQETTVKKLTKDLEDFAKNLQQDYDQLKKGQVHAQKMSGETAQALKDCRAVRDQIMSAVAASEAKRNSSQWIAVGGTVLAIIAITVAVVATGGTALIAVVAGVAAAGAAGYGLVSAASAGSQLSKDLESLRKKTAELNDLAKMALWYESLSMALKFVTEANAKARLAMIDVQNMWAVLEGKLDAVVVNIGRVDRQAVAAMFKEADAVLGASDARKGWKQLAEFATALQNVKIEAKSIPVQAEAA